MNSAAISNNEILKYPRFAPSGWQDIGIKKWVWEIWSVFKYIIIISGYSPEGRRKQRTFVSRKSCI